MDKTETDVSTKPNDLTVDLIEQESLKHESVENEQKEIVPGVTDNIDVQSSNEPEIVSNQYIVESNTVCIYNRLYIYLLINLFIYVYICFLS